MVFRRKDRPGWWTRPRLPGFGRVGQWKVGEGTRAEAERIDQWLHVIVLTKPEVVRGILEGRWSVRRAWVAYLEGGLDELVRHGSDPVLARAVADFRQYAKDDRVRQGLDQLLCYAPKGARLSWLAGRNIAALYARALADGRKPNSVKRSLHRAVADLLVHELGEAARRERFDGVRVPSEDDTRRVYVSPAELQAIVTSEAAAPRFRQMIAAAILTAVDRKPLLELRPVHILERENARPLLRVPDRKARDRWRTLELSTPAAAVFRVAVQGLRANERLFPWKASQVRDQWEAVRAAVGRPDLRWKDLRHVLPTYLAEMGYSFNAIGQMLGHSEPSTTLRYMASVVTGDGDVFDRAAERMGLRHLLLA